jgi:exopolyphosphatase / guanosine-5'-triphosphate,3'-diphosphate pyrophosphatase
MRKAVFDLGTNTFNLLIADVYARHFETIYSDKDAVALGMGGINANFITDDAFIRGINSISKFHSICLDFKVESIHAFGTSALRSAQNASEFLTVVKEKFGFDIEIISGNREAELIYQGVKWSYDFQDPAVIMDIGGGSTEFIFANSQGVENVISLNIGVSRLYQSFTFTDPFGVDDVANIEQWLRKHSMGFFQEKQADIFIGASGTFETFWELIYNKKFPNQLEALEVPFDLFYKVLDEVILSTQAERDQNDFIIPIRKKMAPITAVKTKWVLNNLGVKRIFISPCSLKEGALTA